MTDDRRVARVAGATAAVVALVAALALGVATGGLGAVLVAAVGAGLVGLGAWRFGAAEPRLAAGSVATAAGAPVLGAGVVLGLDAAPLVSVALAAALTAVAIDAGPGFSWSGTQEINHALRRSVGVTAVACALAALVHAGAVPAVAGVVGGLWLAVVTASALVGLVALAYAVAAVVLAFGPVVSILGRWAPADARERVAALSAYAVRPAAVPTWLWAALAGAALLAWTPGAAAWFAGVLALLAPVGPALATALSAPVLHALPAATLVAFGLIGLAEGARRLVVRWLGASPPRAVAHAGGGLVVSAAIVLAVALPPVGAAVVRAADAETVAPVGAGAAALLVAVVAMVGLWVTLAAALLLSDSALQPDDGAGFALGAGALFVATVAAALSGAAAPAAFVGVAATVLVVDLGGYATGLDETMAAGSETRRAEVVHAGASLVVGAGAVVAALVAAYVLVPLAPRARLGSGPEWAPLLALVLALLAAAAFLRLLAVDDRAEAGAGEE